MRRVVPGGRPDWLSPGRCYGTALSSIRSGTLAQRRQDHAHVGPRGRERVPAPALARHRRQAGLSRLRLHDLLRLPATDRPAALALQGMSKRFLDHLGHPVCLAQAAAADVSAGHRSFCNEVKGKSMLALSRELDVQYKTAFVLAHKLREAMASSMKALRIGGEGRVAEIDGAYFGGHVRPENRAADRLDRRLAENRSGKRQVVVVMRERAGRTLIQVASTEAAAVPSIRRRVAKGTVLHADESIAWNPLHASFAMQRINHREGYSLDGACTNGAESYFSRLRRSELGHHHHIAGSYLLRYAQEMAWREDRRRAGVTSKRRQR
jgi:hypothetical protein